MKLVFNPFAGNFDYVSVEDLSPYWKNDGSSTATGDWDIGSYNFDCGALSCSSAYIRGGTYTVDNRLSTDNMFRGYSTSGSVTIDYLGNYLSNGDIKTTEGTIKTSDGDIGTSSGDIYTTSGDIVASTGNGEIAGYLTVGDPTWSSIYYYIEGAYSEIYGSTTNNVVTDFWNNVGGDAAFGLRLYDNLFMVGTDYQLISNTGINISQATKSIGIGTTPVENHKLVVDGETTIFNNLDVVGATLGAEVLSNASFTTVTFDWGAVGDWSLAVGYARYVHSTGTGTLTQPSISFNTPLKADTWYYFSATISAATSDVSCYIGEECAEQKIYFSSERTNGVYFKTNSSPGNFVIHTTSSTLTTFIITAVSVKEVTGGNLSVLGDAAIVGDLTSNAFNLSDKATITWNATDSSIDFTIL